MMLLLRPTWTQTSKFSDNTIFVYIGYICDVHAVLTVHICAEWPAAG